MATPFRSDAQITLHSVSNPTGSWAIMYSRFAAKSGTVPFGTKCNPTSPLTFTFSTWYSVGDEKTLNGGR